jgi:hypothetical protein
MVKIWSWSRYSEDTDVMHPNPLAAAMRMTIVSLALAVAAAIGTWAAGGFLADRGGLGPSIFQSQSPVIALLGVAVAIGLVAVLGGLVARVTTSLTGMFLIGFTLFAMSLQLHGATEFVLSGGNLYMLSLEAVVMAIIVLVGSFIVFTLGGPLSDVPKADTSQNSTEGITMLLIAIVMVPVVWLIATTPEKAQVIGTTAVGGIAIGFLVRQCLPTMQPIMIYAVPTVVGGVGYLIASAMGPTDSVALVQQSISPLLFPMPIDYAAGSVMGLSIGLSWAASLAQPGTAEAAAY